jgi:hypothetical protein
LVKPVTVAVVAVVVVTVAAVAPAASTAVIVYPVIGDPPSEVGGVQLTLAVALPAVATPIAGAPGTVAAGPLHGVGSSGPTLGPMAD